MIEKRHVAVYLLMQAFGGLRMNDFTGRLRLQKLVYLFQVLGVDLQFRFGWYLRGPYSRGLAGVGFELVRDENVRELVEEYGLSPESSNRVELLKELVNEQRAGLDEADWLELLSSIHYIKHISLPPLLLERRNALRHLREYGKTRYTEEHVAAAWQALEEKGLIEHKSL